MKILHGWPLWAAVAVCVLPSCARRSDAKDGSVTDAASLDGKLGTDGAKLTDTKTTDILSIVPGCNVFHRGVLLDLGSPAVNGRFSYDVLPTSGVRDVVSEGATWAKVETRSLSQNFHLDRSTPIFVSARARGEAARAATVRIDGKILGTLSLPKNDIKVVSTKTSDEPLQAGSHVVSLAFHGGSKGQSMASIDWLRVGEPDSDPSTYSAPTLRDLVIDTPIGKRPYRALALRAPGSVHCVVPVPEGMHLRAVVGYAGAGEGEAEVRAVEAGKEPVVLKTIKVLGDPDGGRADPIDVDLGAYAGRLLGLELAAKSAAPGGRVLYGDPFLSVRASTPAPRTRARVVIIIVLSNTNKSQVPPYAEVPALATLTDLAPSSVAFRRYRAPTTVTASVMASLLTGLGPMTHRLTDAGARLPSQVATIAATARDGRVGTAMFTGNPGSFPAFGFNRGWDKYEAFSPVSGVSPNAPMTELGKWIEAEVHESKDERLFGLVHARGGHPPWKATAEEIRNLPPDEYSGPIDARRGGQVLAKARGKRPKVRLKPPDYDRINGFIRLAMTSEDQSLGQLMDVLRKKGLWNSTLLVVTSDVAMGGPEDVPFGDGEALHEDLLETPLIVRFPGGQYGGTIVDSPTSVLDIAPTVLAALDLDVPSSLPGRDLYQIAANPGHVALPKQFASLDASYATRWGDFLLSGTSPKAPSLCDLALSKECADDARARFPVIFDTMFRATYAYFRDAEVYATPRASREPATIDPDTMAALMVWGNQEVP